MQVVTSTINDHYLQHSKILQTMPSVQSPTQSIGKYLHFKTYNAAWIINVQVNRLFCVCVWCQGLVSARQIL
jgi:hypothetical protein